MQIKREKLSRTALIHSCRGDDIEIFCRSIDLLLLIVIGINFLDVNVYSERPLFNRRECNELIAADREYFCNVSVLSSFGHR